MTEELSVKLPKELIEEARVLAERERRTMDGQIQWLIEHGIAATDRHSKRIQSAGPPDPAQLTRREADRAAVSRQIVTGLRGLRDAAGCPSTRVIAKAVGSVSHTTVNALFSAGAVPGLETTLKIVDYLGGDTEFYREMWHDARRGRQDAYRA